MSADDQVTKGRGGAPTIRKQLRFTPRHDALVKAAAERAGVTESEIVRRLIDDVLGEDEDE